MSPGGSSAQAREAVSLPAILLMVTAALTFLYGVYGLVRPTSPEDLERIQQMFADPNMAPMRGFMDFATSTGGRVVFSLPWLIINGLAFFGALKMKNLQSYGLAMTAGIVSLIPCCGPCFCLGIPLGIWALVVLRKPEVRASFT
jgi:predicted PurR-regulated permease PerM